MIPVEEVRKKWNIMAKWWKEYVIKDPLRSDVLFPHILKRLGNVKGKRILDAGCGEGILSRLLAEKGAQVTGVDFSLNLDYAKAMEEEKPLGIGYHKMDIRCMPIFKKGSFDIIVCNLVLHDYPDLEGPLTEFKRVLKDNGRLVISLLHPCFILPERDTWIYKWVLVHGGAGYTEEAAYLVQILENSPEVYYFHRPLQRYLNNLFVLFQIQKTEELYIPSKEGCPFIVMEAVMNGR